MNAYTWVYFAYSENKNHAARTFFTVSFRLSSLHLSLRTRVKCTRKSHLPGIFIRGGWPTGANLSPFYKPFLTETRCPFRSLA